MIYLLAIFMLNSPIFPIFFIQTNCYSVLINEFIIITILFKINVYFLFTGISENEVAQAWNIWG